MKKRSGKSAVSLLILLLVCLILAGCGKSAENDPVVGTWEMDQVEAMGTEIPVKEFLKMSNAEDTKTPVITFKGDHTVKVDILGTDGTGEWKGKDGSYEVTDDSGAVLTLKNNVLSVEYSGARMEFKLCEK